MRRRTKKSTLKEGGLGEEIIEFCTIPASAGAVLFQSEGGRELGLRVSSRRRKPIIDFICSILFSILGSIAPFPIPPILRNTIPGPQ